MTTSVPTFAGWRALGTVVGSTNATLDGQQLLPDALVFPGQAVAVRDGAAMITLAQGSRLVFGRDTAAVFQQEEIEPAVLLTEGSLSIYRDNDAQRVRIRAGEVSVVPEFGFKTVGEIAMLNGAVIVRRN
jgi:hypothetical protein